MDSAKGTTSLREKIVERIAELAPIAANYKGKQSETPFNFGADERKRELEQVLAELDKVIADIDKKFKLAMDKRNEENVNKIDRMMWTSSMDSARGTTSLREKIVERIAILRTAASKEKADSSKWFRLNKTADELEQVLAELDKVIADIDKKFKLAMDKRNEENVNKIDRMMWTSSMDSLYDVLEFLRGKSTGA